MPRPAWTWVALGAGAALVVALALWVARPGPGVRARLELRTLLAGADTAGYDRAVTPRRFEFPADHGPHPGFRTEWWYVTGNLVDSAGRRYGYQLTFFRSGLSPASPLRTSAWATRQAWLAHFALTDAAAGRFVAHERWSRGAGGLAGASASPLRVWLEDWRMDGAPGTTFPLRLRAADGGSAIDLELASGRPVVAQGDSGLSRKGPQPGNASHYYSLTRLPTRGRIRSGGRTVGVWGDSWLDREWSTSMLPADVVGWDWFALQLADGRDLMFYRLRHADGSTDAFSRGAVVRADGSARVLAATDVTPTPVGRWTSRAGDAYPARWRLEVPGERLALEITPVLADQELPVSIRYWEGAVDVRGPGVRGRGYVEMTGYAGRPGPR